MKLGDPVQVWIVDWGANKAFPPVEATRFEILDEDGNGQDVFVFEMKDGKIRTGQYQFHTHFEEYSKAAEYALYVLERNCKDWESYQSGYDAKVRQLEGELAEAKEKAEEFKEKRDRSVSGLKNLIKLCKLHPDDRERAIANAEEKEAMGYAGLDPVPDDWYESAEQEDGPDG